MKLLEAWANTRFDQPPYVFEADVPILRSSPRAKDLDIIGRSCDEVAKHPDYDSEKSLHFSLLPQPFNGDLLNAEIYVLTLNPGFACSDYDANYRKPRYRQALLDNIKQTQPSDVLPFFFLDRKFHRHGGFGYWCDRLRSTIEEIAKCRGISPDEVRNILGRKLAVIELVPYHSKKADGLDKLREMLSSARMAHDFVRQYVQRKARSDRAIVIVVRGYPTWKYALGPDLVCSGSVIRDDNRRGYLSPKTTGGKAIIKWFCQPKP